MKSTNIYYYNPQQLRTFIDESNIKDSGSLLIQVFTSNCNKEYIQDLIDNIQSNLPKAVIIGSTTAGEIMNGKVSDGSTAISFSSFEKTNLKYICVENQKNSYENGKTVAEKLISDDTKLIISFASGLTTSGDHYLDGINSIDDSIAIAGGIAGDGNKFVETFVFGSDKITSSGVVAVALDSKMLSVNNEYRFGWSRIGKELTITKVTDNIVYTINDRSAVDLYNHYLGKETLQNYASLGMMFPLIMKQNGIDIARDIVAVGSDGSLTFAGNFKEGDKVQFGYANPKEIANNTEEFCATVAKSPSEAIFIYSCTARKQFMPDSIESETLPLQSIAPTSGFFTYGEFYGSSSKKLMNQTMTYVSISENMDTINKEINIQFLEHTRTYRSLDSLIHLLNMTAKESTEQAIINQERNLFETLFANSPDGILLIKSNNKYECNQRLLDIFGFESKEQFFHDQPICKNKSFDEASWNKEIQSHKQNGERIWVSISGTIIQFGGDNVTYVICRDISQKKSMEIEISRQQKVLYHKAHHDDLTGLPNRTYFMMELNRELSSAKAQNRQMALLFIDLDRFKKINDSLGHNIGDRVIIIATQRLKQSIKKEAFVSRLSGDEFVVLIKNISSTLEVIEYAKLILLNLKQIMKIDFYNLHTSASIGISLYPRNSLHADNLIKYADTAMYKAKECGGDTYRFYHKEMTDQAYKYVMTENSLKESIVNNDFIIYYQPQIDANSGKIISLEALIRWNHPTEGLLSPDYFIPLAEQTTLIVDIDTWVIEHALKEVQAWRGKGLFDGVLSINISIKHLDNQHLENTINKWLKKTNSTPNKLELEVTETEMMRDPQRCIQILEAINKLGISIAIDDFGTGYSSLSYLSHLPMDKLKIDKSFTFKIPDNNSSMEIIKTIISLAKNLDLEIVAEGVETKEQQDFLVENGCHIMQGYYYSKPVSGEEMEKRLAGIKSQNSS